MAFKSQASIDPNSHKGLILLNSITANPLVATGLSLTNAQPLHVAIVDASGSQVVPSSGPAITNYALETGGKLASIDTKTPALGQALAAASVPVVLTAAQLSTLTPPTTVLVNQSSSPWVSNTSQLGGTAITLNKGASDGGTQRVTLGDGSQTIGAISNTSFTTSELTGLMPKVFDYISANLSGSTADVYTYKAGGAGGSTAATLTVNWTDSTKTVLSTVVRT